MNKERPITAHMIEQLTKPDYLITYVDNRTIQAPKTLKVNLDAWLKSNLETSHIIFAIKL